MAGVAPQFGDRREQTIRPDLMEIIVKPMSMPMVFHSPEQVPPGAL
jgi:hypothetical protein